MAFLLFEVAAKSWENPTFQSTTEFPVSQTETECQVPQCRSASSIHMHSPFIWSVMSRSQSTSERHRLNGGKASDWLRQTQQQESRFSPKSFAMFSE